MFKCRLSDDHIRTIWNSVDPRNLINDFVFPYQKSTNRRWTFGVDVFL